MLLLGLGGCGSGARRRCTSPRANARGDVQRRRAPLPHPPRPRRSMTNYAALADRLEGALGLTEPVGVVITSGDAEAPPADTADASCVHWSSVLTSGRARR